MLPLSEGFVTSFTNERFVDNTDNTAGGLDGGRDFVLDDGGRLTQGVSLGLRLDWLGSSRHVDALHGDPVTLRVPLPHGVGVVNKQITVGEGGPPTE